MSDQPLTMAVFEQFQQKLDRQFDAVARRFDAHDQRFDQLESRMDARFNDLTGQIDAVLHRVLPLEQEYLLIAATMKHLEASAERLSEGQGDLTAGLRRLDEQVVRVEKRLDELVTAPPPATMRAEVQELRTAVEKLHGRMDALERRIDRG